MVRKLGVVAVVAVLAACGIEAVGELGSETPGDAGGGNGPQPDATGTIDGDTSGGGDALAGDATNDGAQGQDAANEGGGDGGLDVAIDACPSTCNAGCGGDGGVCTIRITSYSTATVDCPVGFACRVECTGASVCEQTINCAAGSACTLVCSGNEACKQNTMLNRGAATSLCLVCNSGGTSSTGCDQMSCNATSCTKTCDGQGCGSSCSNCTTASACP